MAVGVRCGRADSTLFVVQLVDNRADWPCPKQVLPTWRACSHRNDGRVSESATMGPMGEAIVPVSVLREGAAFVRSITLVDGSIIAQFSSLITVPMPGKGNCVPLSSL